MEAGLTELIADVLKETVMGALAVFVIIVLQRVYKEWIEDGKKILEEERARREDERADKLMLAQVLQDVAARMAEVCVVLRGLAEKVGIDSVDINLHS